jgi:secreted trypsin-like serine protease
MSGALRTAITTVALLTVAGLIAGCGSSNEHAEIVGGRPADYGTFPSLAFILDYRREGPGQCTGTVAAPSLILTAGHCAQNPVTGLVNPPSGYRVVTGDVESGSARSQTLRVSEVAVYPGFTRGSAHDAYDAALLVLATPTSSPPIALANAQTAVNVPGTKAAIVGWETSSQHLSPTRRLVAQTSVQAQSWCGSVRKSFDPNAQICAESEPRERSTESCDGDSGGPLITIGPSGSDPVEIGIIRAGLGSQPTESCSKLSVLTRLDVISSWIRRIEHRDGHHG